MQNDGLNSTGLIKVLMEILTTPYGIIKGVLIIVLYFVKGLGLAYGGHAVARIIKLLMETLKSSHESFTECVGWDAGM